IPSLPLNLPLIKGASLVGVFWGAFTQFEPAVHRANMAELLDWYAKGIIKPHVSKHFPLSEGAAAIRWMMDRKATGKVVLTA
ncbi:MAG: zinc-binding dehydrogenase, partial [Sphingomonadaceae bacterium]|nr:zinc-binding dehydrogenase [Sphingomonadaceae bacterium]